MKWRLLASMGWAGRAFWASMFVLLVALAGRLLWRASHTETGFGSLAIQWRDATAGWIIGPYEPIYTREPPDQAEYWLAEVDRVLAAHPDDPQLTMGAAIVLHSPCDGYSLRHVIQQITPVGAFSGWDGEGIEDVEDAFENRCRNRSLELAARAARLDPTNVERWRLRALLLRRQPSHSYDHTPRDPDWLRTLDECARHDPDNALYDYIAARFYWDAAADAIGIGQQLIIKDEDGFKKGIARFELGQAKRFVAEVSGSGSQPAAEFLSHTQMPLADYRPIVASRGTVLYQSTLFQGVWRWQDRRAAQEAGTGQVETALTLSRQNLHLIDQYEKGGASQAYDLTPTRLRLKTASRMQSFAAAHPGETSDSENRQIVALSEAAVLEQQVVNCALQELMQSEMQKLVKGQPRPTALMSIYGGWAFADVFVADVVPPLVVLLLVLGLLAIFVSRFADPGIPVVGPVKQALALAVVATTTAVFFGLMPAEVISRPVQWAFFTVVLFFLPVLLVAWGGWCWLRRRAFQFSLGALLLLTLVASVLFSMVAVLRSQEYYHPFYFSGLPFPLSVPRRGWQEISAAVYSGVSTGPHDPWFGAVCQWIAYYGPYLTVVLWAGLVAFLYRRKLRKIARQEGAPLPGRWKRLAGLCHSLGQPALVTAALILAVYLFLSPGLVERGEQGFQDAMAVSRQSPTNLEAMEAAVQKVRSDAARMSRFKQLAKKEAAKLAAEAAGAVSSKAAKPASSQTSQPTTPDSLQ
ncbi:MAG: hypothetical protein ACYC35_18820 [Pirellulales bacterium]